MSGGISNEMHDELIGAGISNLFIYIERQSKISHFSVVYVD